MLFVYQENVNKLTVVNLILLAVLKLVVLKGMNVDMIQPIVLLLHVIVMKIMVMIFGDAQKTAEVELVFQCKF